MEKFYGTQSKLERILISPTMKDYFPLMDGLRSDVRWSIFADKLHKLDRDALYKSRIHGEEHIERVLLLGAFIARDNALTLRDSELLLECCAYHDTGRVDDSIDPLHGLRSSQKLEALTGRGGEELRLIMAAVEAHSRNDGDMESVLQAYEPEDYSRAELLAECLKDADGLDRVRISNLDVRFLRRRTSAQYADFAKLLFTAYKTEV